MVAERDPKYAGNTVTVKPSAVRLSAPRAVRLDSRLAAGAGMRLQDRMPNGDPPNVMLWGDEK